MMSAVIYIYYRIKKINPNYGNGIIAIQFSFIILVHVMPLVSIFDEVFLTNIFTSFDNLTKDDDVVTRRMIKLPILFAPVIIAVYFFLNKNKERIEQGCKKLESMTKDERRRKNRYLWLYIIGSFLFLVLGVTSSEWIPWSKALI